ncbi:MAG: DUF5670 family protein [Chthoniobacterales bacterium]
MNSLIWIAILLVIIWVVALVVLKITGAILHLLLIVAVVLFVVWLIRKMRR